MGHDKDQECVEDRNTLVEYLEQGCKAKSDWRIGTEHEKSGTD